MAPETVEGLPRLDRSTAPSVPACSTPFATTKRLARLSTLADDSPLIVCRDRRDGTSSQRGHQGTQQGSHNRKH